MRHGLLASGHSSEIPDGVSRGKSQKQDDFVLEKSIFNNIFEKDIRRVFMYKKAERLAKAIHLIAPAFTESESLKNRIDQIAVGLVDAAILPPSNARTALSRELLTLSSVLAIARTSGLLSAMNADLISREVHYLLQEVAAYEEPRLSFEEVPTLSDIAKDALKRDSLRTLPQPTRPFHKGASKTRVNDTNKGHLKDTAEVKGPASDRREAVLSLIKEKGVVGIKDISSMIRGVSEKTIQRELLTLVQEGVVRKQGERRWSTYSLT